jgi:hypothetical protein
VRQAPFALRIVIRRTGKAAIVYRRRLTDKNNERLDRITAISSLAFTAAGPLLKEAVRSNGNGTVALEPGPFIPLDTDWGARLACYGLVSAGLTNAQGLFKAAQHLLYADAAESAWWLGLMTQANGRRAIRALRILTEAVQ